MKSSIDCFTQMWKTISHDSSSSGLDGRRTPKIGGRDVSPRSSGFLRPSTPGISGRSSPFSRPTTPSHIDRALKHAAKTLHPYLKAMVAFATSRDFEGKPSEYRLRQEKEKKASVAYTPLFVGISAAFTDKTNIVVAIAIHDSVYLHDYSIHHVSISDNGDPIADFVIGSLIEYEKKHLCKFVGGGLPSDLEKISPHLCSRLWTELDLVPITLRPDREDEDANMEDFTFWHARGVDEQADSMARKSVMCFGPNLAPLLQVGYRGVVEVDSGFRAHMHTLEDYRKSCGVPTWDTMMKYAKSLKEHKTKIAFFSSTPQGGGVALMRHALVRFAKTIGVDLKWYVPKPKPGVFRITKTIHNILQGVAGKDVRISDQEKEAVSTWITEHAERYWLCKGGPLQRPEDGGAHVIIIDDPQMPSLIPLIKLLTPNRPVLYRSHIQVRSDLANKPGTPQNDIWNHLWSKIELADMFISHPMPIFVPNIVPMQKVAYLPATTDWMDGLNKPLGEWDTQYYINLYNQKAHAIRMTELDWPDREYICQIARFDPSKGIPDVIKSYQEFRNRLYKLTGTHENAPQLVIAGNGSVDDPDGTQIHDETMAHLEKHCPNLIDDISVLRLEPNDQLLNALISNAHTVLQLSIREGFEVKVSEGLKKGRPVIATRVGGIPLQVQHEKSGFLVEPGDYNQVATHLMDLWTNQELHERMSAYAAAHVSDEVGTVGNALSWFYLADRFANGDPAVRVPDGKWVNDMARDDAGIPYTEGEDRLPRSSTAKRH